MKLIGITGKPGAGKTTMSNMLLEHEDVGVIHVDELVDDIKLKYFKFMMKKDARGKKVKIDPKLKKILLKNKFLLSIVMRFRAIMLKKTLETRIKELEKAGKQTTIIDDWFFKYLHIYKNLSFIIVMERPFIDRSNSVIKRDKVSKEEVVIGDMGQRTGNYRNFLNGTNIIRINNNLGKAELKEKSEQLYREHIMEREIILENKWKVAEKDLTPILINDKPKDRENVKEDEGR